MNIKGKIAYCAIPESGGLFRFYLNLRKALSPHGWELHALCVGESAKERWDASFADENCHLIAPDEHDPKKAARALSEWVDGNGINILIPMDCSVAASMLPHLEPEVRLVTRCSTVSDFGFRICLLCPERLHRVIVMTPAQEEGLRRYPGSSRKISLIPHGVEVDEFKRVPGTAEDVLRLLYLGRLEDRSKGVLFIPDIIMRLGKAGISCEMDIIGDGVDRNRLEQKMANLRLGNKIKLFGTLTEGHVRKQLNTVHYHALIMPSRYEGFPNAILEAMAAGIIPVVSRLDGITDFIVEDRVNGMLCGIGNTAEFAAALEQIALNKEMAEAMSLTAWKVTRDRFSMSRMGADYNRIFDEVMNEPLNYTPVSWDKFAVNRNYTPSLRNYVPDWIKNIVRRYIRI